MSAFLFCRLDGGDKSDAAQEDRRKILDINLNSAFYGLKYEIAATLISLPLKTARCGRTAICIWMECDAYRSPLADGSQSRG
ncbi:hypothetical protein ACVILI_004252 [Mesorhizobium sp. USDA 4775]|uniref:hypothetical protein n=1 Tax=Mesorhizobium TaxID=68287 RepID=UPI00114CDC8E|nr:MULTISPECIES: hypothetical protein [Mesorhizobium]MCH4561260.1 hypothetical protein [Mesorhizobium jarvisii]QGU20790.1 hypothetical protein MCHK_09795 [Mesorhizobium huakuii 7653R]